jgi:hypothetical protein
MSGSWLDDFARALGVNKLTQAEVEALLDFARDVAHGSERKNAPLAAFLAGRFVGAGGSLDEAVRSAHDILP